MYFTGPVTCAQPLLACTFVPFIYSPKHKTFTMANITLNRLSTTISPADLTTVNNAGETIATTLSFLIALTEEERSSLFSLNVNNKVFVEEALEEAQNNGSILPAYINVAELEKDLTLFNQLGDILSFVRNMLSKLEDTQRLAGHECYATSLAIYQMYKSAAEAGIPGAAASYERLRERFDISKTPPAP